ncbi:hypothetical protein B7O88_11745 [Halopseudomonas aestusnigri]|nr:hypothetical protein B7O88_11745 [Halopseudomonas aestusnigri]
MVFGSVEAIGIDRDVEAISQLRLRRPHWHLSVGDLLHPSTGEALSRSRPVDLLVLNPPFSQGPKKFVEIEFAGREIRGSIAMAHLMRSFDLFRPSLGAIVIAPESLLYSETDQNARQALEERYQLTKLADLQRCTFRGAKVQASVVQILPGLHRQDHKEIRYYNGIISVNVVRGSLPVHMMISDPSGLPFIHSTDLKRIASTGKAEGLSKTGILAKGRTKGWVILLPRVGLPDCQAIKAVKLESTVQLSDCVIALEFTTKAAATKAEKRIQSRWAEFKDLYRGTGARYITIARLGLWLPAIAISPGSH